MRILSNVSLKQKLILSSLSLVILTVIVIGGFSLFQFQSFSTRAMSEAYNGLLAEGLKNMATGVRADFLKLTTVMNTTRDAAVRLAASANMTEFLSADEKASQAGQKEAGRILDGILKTCQVQNALLQQKVNESLSVAEFAMLQYGAPALSETEMVSWTARNQLTQADIAVVLPQFRLGDTLLPVNHTFEERTPIVDDVQKMLNVSSTIFQRMNAEGDLLRIATTIKNSDGTRAIGTYLPAVQPDGTPDPVIIALNQGKMYRGRAYVVNAWYITAYKPILSQVGAPLGALYVGAPQYSLMLEKAILQGKLGTSGYTFVIDSKGEVQIHPTPGMKGKNIVTDLNLPVFQDVLKQKEDNVTKTLTYETEGRQMFVTYLYFPEWDWILCATYAWDDVVAMMLKRATDVLKKEMIALYATSTLVIGTEERPLFSQIRYLDAQGQEIFVLKQGTFSDTLSSKADKPWFQNSLKLKPEEYYNSGVEIAENTNNPEMRIVSPVFMENNLKGLVVVNLDWQIACDTLQKSVYGQTGYAFLLNEEGRVLCHPRFRFEDQTNLGRSEFGDLAAIVTSQMLKGMTGSTRYTYEGQEFALSFLPVPINGHWYTLGATTPVGELMDVANRMKQETQQRFRQTMQLVVGATVLGISLALALALVISGSISNSVKRVVVYAQQVATGDLTDMLRTDRHDEIGMLLQTINNMVQSLRHVIAQIQHSGIQMTSSTTELSATARQQEATITVQVGSVNKVATSVKEITEVMTQLVATMQEVATMSQDTAGFASSGQADLSQMHEVMQHMENASKSISGRLEAINEKAENITTVVTTINKVADQTNLLSLNAAIEAEKAGEYGRGFTVVAREIRRLADQTAVATLDIAQMVHEMQSAVSAGVMEMDKFIAEVRHSAETVENISLQLTRIIEQVQTLSPRFDDVNLAMARQSANAHDIHVAMRNLSDEMEETRASLHETFGAIAQLNEAANGLQGEVSRFKVS